MDLTTQYALLALVITGITEFLNQLRAADYWKAATIATAALTGLVFGLCGIETLTPITGLAAGFGTSGAITAAGHLTNKASSVASTVFRKNK